jgi:large subunit ribosomal protein L32e
VKKVEAPVPMKPEAGKVPSKAALTGTTAKDLADEIESELAQAPAAEPASEPEVEIVEDGSETKKEKKGEEAGKEATEEAEAEAKEGKKKGNKGGKLKGMKKKKKEYRVQPKPELSVEVRKAMELRRVLKDKTPNFIRQDSYNYLRLGVKWRKPRGKHSKLRHHISYRINVVSIGYGSPKAAKGLHPSGFREVLVHHPRELDGVDPKTEAARVAHGVGSRKREMIQRRAERMGIRILNEMETA